MNSPLFPTPSSLPPAPTSPTAPTAPTSPTSPTAPTEPTSPTAPTSPTSLTAPTAPTSPTAPTAPTSLTAPTTPTSPAAPLTQSEFIAFDTETTGIFAGADAIVEIAAIRFTVETGLLDSFHTLVNPQRPIPQAAQAVHGISNQMVKDAPTLVDVMPSFLAFINDSPLVAHNAPFDIGFIGMHLLRENLELPESHVFDTCSFSRRIMPELGSHKLENIVNALQIEKSGFHRALEDTRYCMEVFRHQIRHSCGDSAQWHTLLEKHGPPIRFHENIRRLQSVPAKFRPLLQALQRKEQIWIEYQGGYGPRAITPLLIYAKGKSEYVDAVCALDDSRKSFRLDRIRKVYESNSISYE